jgi:formate hydrogenlyase subunit 6/NADH:ubiquinone oxidoreductase subunit I
MSGLRSLIYLLPELWRTLFSRPITVRYPYGPLELPSSFRGRIVIDPEVCRGCGMCVRDCPSAALALERESRDKFRLLHYHDRCCYCGQCEISCRLHAIKPSSEFVPPASSRDAFSETIVEK